MRSTVLLLAAGALASACQEPTQPANFRHDRSEAPVVHVAAPTGDPTVDVPNIQAAINAATAGAVIQFARGAYVLEQETQFVVSIPGVTLQGHPRGTTLRGVSTYTEPFFFRGVFLLNGGKQRVRRLTFEGFQTALSLGAPGTTTGGYRVEHSTFRNGFMALEFMGFSDDVSTVQDNEFVNGARPINVFGKTVHIRRNRITAPDPAAIPFGQPWFAVYVNPDFLAGGTICENNVMEKNTVVGYADGFTLDAWPGEICRNNIIRQNEVIGQRLYGIFPGEAFFNGTLVWIVSSNFDPAHRGVHQGNRVEGNVLRGSEGIGIILDGDDSDNRIVDNEFSDLVPTAFPTGLPFAGTAIFLGEGTSGNRVRRNEFENVVNTIVDLGTGNDVKGATSATRLTSPPVQASSDTRRVEFLRGIFRNRSGPR